MIEFDTPVEVCVHTSHTTCFLYVYLNAYSQECVTRLQKRTDHETLKNFAEAKGILNLGIKNWVPPHPSEVSDRSRSKQCEASELKDGVAKLFQQGYERHLQLYPVPLGATHESNASSTRPGRSSVVRHPISYPNSPTLIGSIMSLLESTPAVELSDIPPQQQNRRSHPSRGSKRGGQKSHGSASESSRKQSSRS